MSRTAIAIFGLVAVAGVNAFGPAVAQRISLAVGLHHLDPAGAGVEAGTQLALETETSRQAAHAGWEGDRLVGVH